MAVWIVHSIAPQGRVEFTCLLHVVNHWFTVDVRVVNHWFTVDVVTFRVFAFLPKKELSSIAFDLFEDDFIAIKLGISDSLEIIKVIPINIESEIVAGQFWINKNELIKKMIVITKEQGSFEIDFNYNNNKFDLPSSLVMTFDVKNQDVLKWNDKRLKIKWPRKKLIWRMSQVI